jgi:hypothetical protein
VIGVQLPPPAPLDELVLPAPLEELDELTDE